MELHLAYQAAQALLREHGLSDWQFQFTSSRRKFGTCWYRKRKITFSRELTLINTDPVVLNVIRHEIAHAIAGFEAGHGPEWVRIARSIGCDGIRCYDRSYDFVAKKVEHRWIGTCPECGKTYSRHNRPKKKRPACGKCCKRFSGGIFDPKFTLRWAQAEELELED
jgi:predicted SprT family Zn-dependent metalloprotease